MGRRGRLRRARACSSQMPPAARGRRAASTAQSAHPPSCSWDGARWGSRGAGVRPGAEKRRRPQLPRQPGPWRRRCWATGRSAPAHRQRWSQRRRWRPGDYQPTGQCRSLCVAAWTARPVGTAPRSPEGRAVPPSGALLCSRRRMFGAAFRTCGCERSDGRHPRPQHGEVPLTASPQAELRGSWRRRAACSRAAAVRPWPKPPAG
mmetsp:Transcript_19044/g.72774  ORF Transcript_19044/g.72774 Transcript_19044/m.72774 type:complete len:205 (-) Transcript_19044:702-1316(-)